MTQTTPPTPPPRRLFARSVATVTGAVVGLVALALLVGGGALLWADAKKDDDGYVSTHTDRFHTGTYALATDDLDIDADAPGWLVEPERYGKVRLKATSHRDTPVFVGIARTSDVASYLDGTAHATVTDLDYDPFRVDYRTQPRGHRPAPPATKRFWVASAHGTGTQTVTWDVRHGSWSIVVMNADGSAGVDAGVSAGANAPWLTPVAWGTLGGGILLLVAAGGLIYLGVRTPRGPSAERSAPDAAPAAT